MLSAQEISDRFEIQDLLVRYSQLLDARDFTSMGDLFTDDAVLDYTATGAVAGTWPEVAAFVAKAFEGFAGSQHVMGLPSISVTGDTATARTICFNPMVVDRKKVFFVGLWYADELVRCADGWRFARRTEELSYFHNL